MKWGKIVLILVGILGLLLVLSFFFFVGMSSYERDGISQAYLEDVFQQFDGPYYPHGLQSEAFFNAAYDQADNLGRLKTQAIIVPHHLIVAKHVAALIDAAPSADTIVILSPNHFDAGRAPAQIAAVGYTTPYGEVTPDLFAIEKLLEASDVLIEEDGAFESDHGIAGLMPFIARSHPQAEIVPIILHESIGIEAAQTLGTELADTLPNALVIASIDFSHNLPNYAQEAHDELVRRTLESGSVCLECAPLEIDSNASLAAVMRFAELKGDQVWNELSHTNSLSLTNADWIDNTSHFTGYFSSGEAQQDDFAALHFVGDIMLDRGTRLKLNEYGMEYPWEDMQRFLMGAHLRIGNLEGTVNEQASTYTYDPPFRFVFSPESVEEMGKYIDVVSLANNHTSDVGTAGELETKERLTEMGIDWFGSYLTPDPVHTEVVNGISFAFIGYHQFQPDEERLVELIQEYTDSHFVVVMPHWGTEYVYDPSSSQRALAQMMVDAGADLIIGGHPHVVQGIELVDDVPVLYSLGNFIFDQYIPITWQALTAHVIVDAEEMALRLLPIEARDGQPSPVSDEEAQVILNLIADHSDEALQQSIKEGLITISYE